MNGDDDSNDVDVVDDAMLGRRSAIDNNDANTATSLLLLIVGLVNPDDNDGDNGDDTDTDNDVGARNVCVLIVTQPAQHSTAQQGWMDAHSC
jgi:hypothetical protein